MVMVPDIQIFIPNICFECYVLICVLMKLNRYAVEQILESELISRSVL